MYAQKGKTEQNHIQHIIIYNTEIDCGKHMRLCRRQT